MDPRQIDSNGHDRPLSEEDTRRISSATRSMDPTPDAPRSGGPRDVEWTSPDQDMVFSSLLHALRQKWVVLAIAIGGGVLSFFGSSLIPKTFRSEATIQVIGEKNSTSAVLSSVDFPLKDLMNLKGNADDPTNLLIEIMASREVLVELIREQRLDSVYDKKPMQLVIKRFLQDLEIGQNERGFISCAYESDDAGFAQRILQQLISKSQLRYDRLRMEQLRIQSAKLKAQENEILDTIARRKHALFEFYERNGLVNVESQLKYSVESMIDAEVKENELSLQEDVLSRTLGATNSRTMEMREELNAYRKHLDKLQRDEESKRKRGLLISPRWGLRKRFEERMLVQDLEVSLGLFQMAVKERLLVEAKIRQNLPVVQIVQAPYLPDWKVKPKRMLLALGGGMLAGIAFLLASLLKAMLDGRIFLEAEARSKMRSIVRHLWPV